MVLEERFEARAGTGTPVGVGADVRLSQFGVFANFSLSQLERPEDGAEQAFLLPSGGSPRGRCHGSIFDRRRHIKVSDTEFAAIRIARDDFHGEWNYVISPNQ